MKPERSNYEIWVIDWLDGNLSDNQVEELKSFLNENPDLKDEFEGIAQVNLKSGQNTYAGKEFLRRSVQNLSSSQFENLCIAYLENDLSEVQRSELLDLVNNKEDKRREFDLIQKIRLKPPKYIYAGKKRIKRLTMGQKVIRMSVAGLSAAAAILILVVVFLSSPSVVTTDQKQALNTPGPDTMTIQVTPSIINEEKGTSAPQKSVSPGRLKLTSPEAPFSEQKILISEQVITQQSDSVFQILREASIAKVIVRVPENPVNAPVPVPAGLLAHSKYATVPSPFEEDRSNVDRFLARLFHEKIMKDKAGASPVKSYDIAVAGITGLNKLFGWEIALHKNTDENGEVRSYKFSSRLVKFNTPVKKESDTL